MALFLLLAATFAAAESGDRQRSEAPTEASVTDDSFEQLVATYEEQLFAGRYAEAFASASGLPDEVGDRSVRAMILAMRGAALLGLKREDESTRLFAEADALAPQEPYPTNLRFKTGLRTNNIEVAADAIDRLIARYPDKAREVPWRQLVFFLSNVPKSDVKRNEDRLIALARLGYGADADHGDQIAELAIGALVKRGDHLGARELLPFIDEPHALQSMLIQKRYSALWPALEQQAGPHLSKAIASSVANAERGYQAAPSDPERLVLLAEAYRGAGRLDDVIALRSKLPQAMATVSATMGWAVNSVAMALKEKGRVDEADRLVASLVDVPREDGAWRVSMRVNRLQWLVSAGLFERALPLLEPTEAAARTEGNAYAQQLVRTLQFCTYYRLGQTDKASAMLPELLAKAKDAPAATIDRLLCANELDHAQAVAEAALSDEAFEVDFVRMFQPDMLVGQSPTVWSSEWAKLRARPSVAAAYQRLARDLPKQFLVSSAP